MNNEQQTYVLKRPINAWPNFDSNEMVVELENDDYRCSLEAFNEDFVPLDVSGLTRQVEELSKPLFVKGREGSTRYVDEVGLAAFAEQVVLLLLNQEGETK